MINSKHTKQLLKFPCKFPLKIMGVATEEFEKTALNILKKHIANLDQQKITKAFSKNAKYLSITITFKAKSKQQLDNIYQALHQDPAILMAL